MKWYLDIFLLFKKNNKMRFVVYKLNVQIILF